jgi:hypothetical protein
MSHDVCETSMRQLNIVEITLTLITDESDRILQIKNGSEEFKVHFGVHVNSFFKNYALIRLSKIT